ncbi:MAG: hypothetical protein HYX37_20755 [Rhizobiales bacterium]|jgi:hypothetical protein|nr:hypothetical protein [Hyphomicrobiales bacterium]
MAAKRKATAASALGGLNWRDIRRHYSERKKTHAELLRLFERREVDEFVDLILGVDDPTGNYSANDHELGPKILGNNLSSKKQVWGLASRFLTVTSGKDVPALIRNAAISYLAISVGSEASCMLKPDRCWVTNVRTVWTHLVFQYDGLFEKANEALRTFREKNPDSEMRYERWMDPFHRELLQTLDQVRLEGNRCAIEAGVRPGQVKFLWTDAIASALYDTHHRRSPRFRATASGWVSGRTFRLRG